MVVSEKEKLEAIMKIEVVVTCGGELSIQKPS